MIDPRVVVFSSTKSMIPHSLLDQLHYVKVDNSSLDLQYFPDFMIIGPPRTGTTWLADNLRFHPQIMMTVPKEIWFFNRLKQPKNPKFISAKLDWYLTFFQDSASSDVSKRKRHFCAWKYAEAYKPIVRGEATASYAVLDKKVIREIFLLNPQLRLIMLVRNPIDRAWSHAKLHFTRHRRIRLQDVTMKDFQEFVNRPFQRRCAQYTQNIDRWLSYFDESSLFIGWFDDIQQQPVELLVDVLNFLGVNADTKYIQPYATEIINATERLEMSFVCRKVLESLLREDIQNLEKRFGVHFS